MRRFLVQALVIALLAAACATTSPSGSGGAGSPAASAPGQTAASSAASLPPGSAAPPAGSSSGPDATASGPPRVPDGAIGGTWKVRLELARKPDVELVREEAFQDRVFDVRPDCPKEPCAGAKLAIYLLNDPAPLVTFTLARDGDEYVATEKGERTGRCRAPDGGVVEAGAVVTRSVALWRQVVKPEGTAVTHEELGGVVRYTATPNEIGAVAGCVEWTATYTISGRAGWYVPVDPATVTPPPGGKGQVANVALTTSISGATIDYFPIGGTSVAALAESLANGGLRACGSIDYSWYRGDTRPSACIQAEVSPGSLTPSFGSSGSCTIGYRPPLYAFVAHLPQWTSPSLVPGPLYTWWKKTFDFISRHEAGHVAIYQRALADLGAKLAGATCTNAPSIISAWASKVGAEQEAYDRAEYAKPWPQPPAGY